MTSKFALEDTVLSLHYIDTLDKICNVYKYTLAECTEKNYEVKMW